MIRGALSPPLRLLADLLDLAGEAVAALGILSATALIAPPSDQPHAVRDHRSHERQGQLRSAVVAGCGVAVGSTVVERRLGPR